MDADIRRLALGAAAGLMDHNLAVGQRKALALGAGSQQERAHAGRHAHADGGHVALDILHGIVNRHAVAVTEPPGLLIYRLNVLVRILTLQIQQLGHHQRWRWYR